MYKRQPTDRLIRLYERWADDGPGLLITGNVMIDRAGVAEPGNVVIDGDRHAARLSEWASAATSGGAQAWAQINHGGRQIPRTLNLRPVAPSPVRLAGVGAAFATPRELTGDEIDTIIAQFADTARTVLAAGFTGVQVHAAHGYLINQFLSPLTNQRRDEWGGSPENRRRFLLAVVRAIRAEIGPAVPLAVKLNSADFQRGGFSEDDSMEVVAALADENVDLLEISGGTYESAAMMGVSAQPAKQSTREREAYFLDYAEKVRTASTLPLMLTGGFRTPAGMAAALDSGAIDLVGLARPLALQPGLARDILAGQGSVSTVRPRRIGIRAIDGAAETSWYVHQLHRMGAGKDPNPNQHPVEALARYAVTAGLDTILRSVTR